ncbi:TPM domain-containing protein [Hymenobacter glacialis]|uniref:TPM domain-containing protein n=1 Tax=Hymenobacter glacialis TaxID=1908236 RepID=A0A1G1T405_9BACT|nr:TPM domain-containing protein [Hymenobacter glacialis]OGX85602.1 hypothetical protein BEN48_01850 [Hymenobacter glacialis]
MYRFLFLLLLLVSVAFAGPAAAQSGAGGLPPRPNPFKFVNDQAGLMEPADAKKLENGLRRYADNTGTQIVVVTVPTLGGRSVADYGRALGTAWGVGQRNKNNGVVVLLSGQERQVTIQPGSGLAGTITPAVTNRIISEMTPGFKQGNYFAGLRAGLNTLMVMANPDSAPQAAQSTTPNSNDALGAAAGTDATGANLSGTAETPVGSTPYDPMLSSPSEPESTGPGMMTLLLGALAVGGVLWFLVRMFRRRSAAPAAPSNSAPASATPNFLPNRRESNDSSATPNFLPNRPGGPSGGPGQGNNNNPNQGSMTGGSGMGMGGMLTTGAAAAAGAYLGNRMASGHDTGSNSLGNAGNAGNPGAGTAAGLGGAGLGAAGTGAANDYFSSRDGGDVGNTAPDYFSAQDTADNSGDYFSADDNSSYDDPNSGDSGGGGFDGDDDNSGSW